jgi:SAM-dependent methyltransferase
VERYDRYGHGVEVLDLIVDLDRAGANPVRVDAALHSCELAHDDWASRLIASIPARDGVLEQDPIDDLVIGVHREIDRLSSVARHGPRVRDALRPLIETLRAAGHPPPYRIVDQGCGTGYIIRWLAADGVPDDVELVGVDVNPLLVDEARRLAADGGLACRFEIGDALEPDHEATVIVSTALLHHLSPADLVSYFTAQARGAAVGYLHIDLRPGAPTVLGVALVHGLLMRLPVSRHDGIRSAQRAHSPSVLAEAAQAGAPGFTRSTARFRLLDPLAPMLTMIAGLRTPSGV